MAFSQRFIQNPSANRQIIFEKCGFRNGQHPRHGFSWAKEQPSRCLLHADWMMLNNALLQMPHVGEETGTYSCQRFIYWLAWCEVYGAWWKPNIWIPCMVQEWSNWGGINLYIKLQKHKFDQILQEKHKKLSRQAYSFLQEKLPCLRRKTWEDKYLSLKANTWRL